MRRNIALGLVVVVAVGACVFLIAVLVGEGPDRAAVWAGIVAALAGVVAAWAAVWVAVPPPSSKMSLPRHLEVPKGTVDRPIETVTVVNALVGKWAGTVGITIGLYGEGGFGKTTLAQMVCADRRVKRRFGGRMYLVSMGRDVRGATTVAAKVNDLIMLVG